MQTERHLDQVVRTGALGSGLESGHYYILCCPAQALQTSEPQFPTQNVNASLPGGVETVKSGQVYLCHGSGIDLSH